MVKLEPNTPVKISVTRSACSVMREGDVVYLRGPLIDCERSAPLCLSALVGIYPWVMTARFGIESQALGHREGYRLVCPDGLVEFLVTSDPHEG